MTPVVAGLASTIHNPIHVQALWWALAIGSGFGGNMTAVGASANVVMVGIAGREGFPIGFWEFTRTGAAVTALTIAVSAPYLWLRYFVFS
jgi:Na+/H+ antiporter NhaD/arsenite permease-like protein